MRRATMPSLLTCAFVCQACAPRSSSVAEPQPAPREPTPADAHRAEETPPPESPVAPIIPPSPNEQGCVDQAEFQTYASALEAQATAARDRALAALGVQALSRAGFVVPRPVGPTYEVKGKRFAVVGFARPERSHEIAAAPASVAKARGGTMHPTANVAKARDGTIHPLEPQIKVHWFTFTVCGLPCAPGRGVAEPAPEALVIELADGESLGAPLRPAYEISIANADTRCHGMNAPPP
jgi:hypothetical protein